MILCEECLFVERCKNQLVFDKQEHIANTFGYRTTFHGMLESCDYFAESYTNDYFGRYQEIKKYFLKLKNLLAGDDDGKI